MKGLATIAFYVLLGYLFIQFFVPLMGLLAAAVGVMILVAIITAMFS